MKYYREEKQDFERFLIFLNIKMITKTNKIEFSEDSIAMWRDEQTLWYVMSPLCRNKNEKDKTFRYLKRMSDKFQIFSDWYLRIKFCFKYEIFLSAYPGDS